MKRKNSVKEPGGRKLWGKFIDARDGKFEIYLLLKILKIFLYFFKTQTLNYLSLA